MDRGNLVHGRMAREAYIAGCLQMSPIGYRFHRCHSALLVQPQREATVMNGTWSSLANRGDGDHKMQGKMLEKS